MSKKLCYLGLFFFVFFNLIGSSHARVAPHTSPASLEANAYLAGDITYIYDDLGRLIAVVDPSGDTAVYHYDAVGNLLSISRYSSSSVSIITFTPGSGAVGASVTIYGTGFSTTPSQNAVTFNGTAATVTAATATQLITTVPAGATTGTIGVTSPSGSATSSASFTVTTPNLNAPTISSFTPTIALPGTAVTITGTNFDSDLANNEAAFDVVQARINSSTTTSINTNVPQTGSGHLSVTTPNGTAVSTGDFFIPPPGYTVASVTATGRLTYGTATNLPVITANNLGLYLFDGTMGQRVYLDITNVSITGNATISIYNPNRTVLASKSVNGATFFDSTLLPATGSYMVMVTPWNNYTVNSMRLTAYSVPADVTGTITAGGAAVSPSIPSLGQRARLTFSGTSGQRVSLKMTSVTIGGSTPVTIYNPDTTTLASVNVTSGAGGYIDAITLPATGTYTILIDPYATNTGNATLTLYDVVDVTGSITVGGSAVTLSTTSPGQNASYTFSGTSGDRVSFNITSVSIFSSAVSILKPDATTLVTYGSVGSGGYFFEPVTLPATGTYTIFVNPSTTYTGNMTLRLYSVTDVTGTITIGGSPVTISLPTPGQKASLTFSGTSGQRVSLQATSVTITNTPMNILNPNGTTLVAGGASSGAGGYIDAITLPTTGTYTIAIDPYTTYTGNATLTLYDVVDISSSITVGGSAVTASITTLGQNASYTFSGTTGDRVSLHVTSVSIFSSSVAILKPDGTTLVSNGSVGSGGAFFDTVTLPATGTYTLVVNPGGFYTGNMTLRLYSVTDVTGAVTIGGSSVPVSITTPGQNGQFTFSGTASQQVTVRITSNSITSVTVKLLRPDGTQLTSGTGGATFNLTTQTLPTTGTYTIVIDPPSANTGSLNVSVTSP